VSDLTPVSALNGWGPVEKDRSNGEQQAGDGRPLTLDGQVFAKGLGVHADSDVRYTVPTGCTSFTATVGVDDEVWGGGSVVFQTWTGTTKTSDSGLRTGASPNATVSVPVQAGSQLRLVVTDGGDGNGADHADWADARLTCGSTEPPRPRHPTAAASAAPVRHAVRERPDAGVRPERVGPGGEGPQQRRAAGR
jgi:hypothetical protein